VIHTVRGILVVRGEGCMWGGLIGAGELELEEVWWNSHVRAAGAGARFVLLRLFH
jgi:hypothetical protein